uniref:Scavenger receptor cysteine-rich type 1 protein M130-like n=1 Tax=Nothobranchius furzeri TaxID=105023 RepID=A0A8C6LBY0_NOTFU
MWFLLLFLHSFTHFEPVSLEDNFRLFLRSSQGPCEGHVEVSYNGEWGYVGDKYWNTTTEEVVCRSTHCGTPVENSTRSVRRSMKKKVWLNELKCDGNESNLWDCPNWPGPGVSFYQKPTVKKVRCSYKIKIELKPHRCEGAVWYSVNGKHEGYICNDKFSEADAERLCESLQCGSFSKKLNHEWTKDEKQQTGMKIDCSGLNNVTDLWQCAQQQTTCKSPASISCKGHDVLQLVGNQADVCSGQLEKLSDNEWKPFQKHKVDAAKLCSQMHCGTFGVYDQLNQSLACSDRVEVFLKNDMGEKCYGEVMIRRNGTDRAVCGSIWTEKEAKIVCSELKCGTVLKHSVKQSEQSAGRRREPGLMDHVKCEGSEASLWHCRAKHVNLKCPSVPQVICSESMAMKLVDGPGKCAGKLMVKSEGRWKQASKASWSKKDSDFVCRQLNCGDKSRDNALKFNKGGSELIKMKCSSGKTITHIHDCIDPNQINPTDDPLAITCEEHKVVLLNGSCSGLVEIEHGDRSYLLSGSNETWNQEAADTVCRQMHCGKALNFSVSLHNKKEPLWGESRRCSSNDTSLFECNAIALPPDHNDTVASVTCSGEINMTLSSGCFGFVEISAAGKKGRACGDTWTNDMSKQLCRDLGCGNDILESNKQDKTQISFKSFHGRGRYSSPSTYSFNLMEHGERCDQSAVYVVCTGSVKPRFKASQDKCSGNIEMSYDGKWLPVSKDSLEHPQTRNTICGELKCGDAESVTDYFGPPVVDGAIKIGCSSGKMETCQISIEKQPKASLGGLRCAEWKKMALEVDHACEGDVSIYSKGASEDKRSVVSSQGWTEAEGRILCQNLRCGDFLSTNELLLDESETLWGKTFKCSGNPQSIWDCETEKLQAKPEKKAYLKCQAKPKVTLAQKCSGELKIDSSPVCKTGWKTEYSHRVCQELNCGNAIEQDLEGSSYNAEKFYVQCDDHIHLISQCKRVLGKCQKSVSISCTESVEFSSTQRCGGLVEIRYNINRYLKVCNANLDQPALNNLCQRIGCGPYNYSSTEGPFKEASLASLECPATYRDARYCIKQCQATTRASIYCEGYQPSRTTPSPTQKTNPIPIITAVGFVLILVILIGVFVRYHVVMRNRRSRRSANSLPGQGSEWESGNYEDVDKSNEIQSTHDGFRSESEFMPEKDGESYDDVDEVTESQPLTAPGSSAAAPKDNSIQEEGQNQNDDGVTFEVDDPQEDNYDDIGVTSEATQVKVDVYDKPKTTAGSDTEAAENLVQNDGDYLVPGQEG